MEHIVFVPFDFDENGGGLTTGAFLVSGQREYIVKPVAHNGLGAVAEIRDDWYEPGVVEKFFFKVGDILVQVQ